jgi:hypothetical protein
LRVSRWDELYASASGGSGPALGKPEYLRAVCVLAVTDGDEAVTIRGSQREFYGCVDQRYQESIHTKWLADMESAPEDCVAASLGFEQRFCWVLISLIVAIAVLVALVAIAVVET